MRDMHTDAECFVMAIKSLMANQNAREAINEGNRLGLPMRAINCIKGAVSVGSTTDPSWAASLADYRLAGAAYVASLKNQSAYFRMKDSFVAAPLNTQLRVATGVATGMTVGQAMVVRASTLSFTLPALDPKKVMAFVAATEELIRYVGPKGEALIDLQLRQGTAAAVDSELFATLKAASPTEIVSAGSSADSVAADLRDLVAAVNTGATSQLFLVGAPDVIKAMSTMTGDGKFMFPELSPKGGFVLQVPTLVSDELTAGELWLIDANSIAVGDEGLEIKISRQGSVQLDSSPDSPATASTVLLSLWQNDLIGLACTIWLGIKPIRNNGFAYISGITWGSGSSP